MPTGSYRPAHTLCALAVALIYAGVALPVVAADAAPAARQQSGTYTFAVAQQPLVAALNDFSQVTGWQVGLPAELAQGVASPGVKGALTPEKALERLLLGTGLSYRKLGDNSVVLERSVGAALALQQITVSATRQADEVSKVPATVTVHTRDALDQQNVNDIRDLVRYEPGVSVGGAGNRAGTTGYNIRGIDGNRILTQVDGVEVPDSFFNGPYAQTERNYVDPEIIKRVEILRGPASVLYGSSAIGGAVSYFTLDPEDIIKPGQDYGARLKTGYSSKDDSWLKSATLAGHSGDFDGLVHFSQRDGHETESYGEHGGTGLNRTEANPEDARKTNVLAKVGWNYAEDSRLAFTYEKHKSDVDTNQLSAVGGPFGNGVPTNIYRARHGNDTITRERLGVAHDFSLDSALADHVRWSFNYQKAKTDQSTEEIYTPIYSVLRTRETLYQERQWILDAQADKAFNIADTEHLLTYGTTLKRQKATGSRTGTATCLNALSQCASVGIGGSLARLALSKQSDFPDPTVDTYAFFAQDQINWNQWTLTPGVRYTNTRLRPHATDAFLASVTPTPGGSFDDSTKIWHKFTPSLGATYAFNEHYTWYGQYSEGFRTPSPKSLYGNFENLTTGYVVKANPGLKPEESRSYETGLRGNFDVGSFDLAVFYNQYKNFINEDVVINGKDFNVFQANNVKHAVIKGAELKGRLNLDTFGAQDGMYARGSMAYQWGENQDTGAPLNTVNPFTSVLGLGYSQAKYGGELAWTLVKRKTRVDDSTFYAPDGANKFHPPGYGVVDLTGFYKLTSDLTVSGGIYNLANKKYWQWDDVRSYDGVGEAGTLAPANIDRLTQPGRNFAVNLVWDL